jgi:hypothetical protein
MTQFAEFLPAGPGFDTPFQRFCHVTAFTRQCFPAILHADCFATNLPAPAIAMTNALHPSVPSPNTTSLRRTVVGLMLWLALAGPLPVPASAAPPPFPASHSIDNITLLQNGAGVREYGWLRIAVYTAALYLPERSHDAEAILAANTPRLIRMHLLRDVSQADSRKAWQHYLQANCQHPCVLTPASQTRFDALIPESKAGDNQDWLFRDGKLVLYRNGLKLGEIHDAVLARTVLASWIGKVPTTEALRQALLGTPAVGK